MKRRNLLKSLGLAGAACAVAPALRHLPEPLARKAAAQSSKRLVIVRSCFDLRDKGRTHVGADLAPLAPWSSRLLTVTGLNTSGDGSEYHNGKQIRFATSCTPTNRTMQNYGGGAFDGKSVDRVVGEHLQAAQGSRVPGLILGAYPYSVSDLHTTFETITFASRVQYLRPEYDYGAVQRAAVDFAGGCTEVEGPPVDEVGLRRENRILELVLADLGRSRRGTSSEVAGQVEMLEAQFDALRQDNLRELEGAGATTCMPLRMSKLGHDYARDGRVPEAFDPQVREMNFTAALALKANYTSAVTLNYNFSGHGQPGVPGYHEYTHPGGFSRPPNGEELASLDALSAFQIQMLAHLVRELEDFGILDDTLIVYSTHERPTHDHDDVPVIALNAGPTGQRALERQVTDMNRDILEWVGVPQAANFGGETSRGGVIR